MDRHCTSASQDFETTIKHPYCHHSTCQGKLGPFEDEILQVSS